MRSRLYWVLALLPLAAAVCALFVLPDQIPAHYDLSMNVDRWGSKFEVLILPLITLPYAIFMERFLRWSFRKSGTDNPRMLNGILCAVILPMDVLTLWIIAMDYTWAAKGSAALALDLPSVTFAVIGLIFLPLANWMPKVARNPVFGLRTSWSMKNDRVWAKCQRLGSRLFLGAGGALILGNLLLFRGEDCLWFSMVVVLAATFGSIWGSWRIAKADEKNDPKPGTRL